MPRTSTCRVCAGVVGEFLDLGQQPLSDAFVLRDHRPEFSYRLAVGLCERCSMVQLMEEVPRDRMFHDAYPYLSSGSTRVRAHFEEFAEGLLRSTTEPDPFFVEIGCNDGAMLKVLADAGVRHIGVEPSGGVADRAAAKGVQVRKDFFDEHVAEDIVARHGRADVVFAANTLCHIPYLDSVLRGVLTLVKPNGVFVFEDPYFAEIIGQTAFDQIYDEHFFYFTVRSVGALAARNGFDLVDVRWIPLHGGELRYTLAAAGARPAAHSVGDLLSEEDALTLADPTTLARFADKVERNCRDLTATLRGLRDAGKRVVGYGATAKSATVLNFCGIGPDLIPYICDSSSTKQGRLTPGSHIPIRPPAAFSAPRPDYAVLFAWNHADEIMAKETDFRDAGGRWIRYVPHVRVT